MITQEIIRRMKNVAADLMGDHARKDFEKYTLETVNSPELALPAIWCVGKSDDAILQLPFFRESFFGIEGVRYWFARGNGPWDYYLKYHHSDWHYFLITGNSMTEITQSQAYNASKDYIQPVIHDWVEAHGPLPKGRKLDLKFEFSGLTFTEFKALLHEHDGEKGFRPLLTVLKQFRQWGKVCAGHGIRFRFDRRDKIFYFGEFGRNDGCGVRGAVVYHGSEGEGYSQNGSVQIEPNFGWASHT